ncbi:MAG TPA: KUP/HAK/KT family potassium transporter, partial [Pseudoxanthomonas sp.]|nr:KUP/HAK/KT family potassium transporter [Pseudoxanthomonas sp.]
MSASASSSSTASHAGGHGHDHGHGHGKQGLAGLVIAAGGVVFGDIGTSPLYTLKEAFSEHFHLQANHDTVLGILSLVFWAMM